MKKTLIAAAVAGALVAPGVVLAQAAATSPHTITANVGVVSDYLFRGISQTHGAPAIQGGVDYSHASGLYAGTWLSSISWVGDGLGGSYPTEVDLYAGYKNTIGSTDFGYDVGVITYMYPGSGRTANSIKPDTTEVYGALSWKILTLKYSHTISDNFVGWGSNVPTRYNSQDSNYLELNAAYDLGNGWGITGHVGHQKVKNYPVVGTNDASYTDYKVGVTKDVGFGVVGLAYSWTDNKGNCSNVAGAVNTSAYCWGVNQNTTDFTDVARDRAVLSFSKTF